MKPQDMKDLRELIEFLKEYQVAEFDLDRGDTKLRLKFTQPAAQSAGLADIAKLVTAAPVANSAAPNAAAPAAQPAADAPAADPDANRHIVKSPIVGTFYGSPSAGAFAF